MRMAMSKAKPSLAGDGGAQQARARGGAPARPPGAAGDRCIRRADRRCPARADRPRADGHALEHQVGEVGEDDAVLERARLALVGVADDVFLFAGRLRPPIPISGWWGSRRRPAAQPGAFPLCAARRPAGGPAPPASPLPGSMVLNVNGLVAVRTVLVVAGHMRRSLGDAGGVRAEHLPALAPGCRGLSPASRG